MTPWSDGEEGDDVSCEIHALDQQSYFRLREKGKINRIHETLCINRSVNVVIDDDRSPPSPCS